ncbi:MmcQ/YjbR family DNA-binding protein [uncultured Frigoribacterium sp.]|uniref:MmcQ/YjbR family DNA-binding protein n=1 Tax=uncultured Frigoribacterium sp. TaxID=335377 RepID=UPI0028D86CD2|nr:MmcQ/YjbR family DNA-binding protein [uncultured Frigoribacterium sp.]
MATTTEQVQAICAEQPSAELTFPFGLEIAVYKVRGKIFALVPVDTDQPSVSLKAVPEHAEQLRAEHPEITPGWHLNKRHWITLDLSGDLPATMVEDLVGNSYDRVIARMPKSRRPLA